MGYKKKSIVKPPPVHNALDDEHCIVSGSYAYLLRISSFFGMAPLRFSPCGNEYAVSISKYKCVYSCILVTVVAGITLLAIATELKRGPLMTDLSQFVSWCDVIMVSIMAGVGAFGAPCRMKCILKLMDALASVDKRLGTQNSHMRERRLWVSMIFFQLYITLLTAAQIHGFFTRYSDRFVLTHYVGHYILWYLVMFLELQFAFTVMLVQARFQAANEALTLTARHIAVLNTWNVDCPSTLNNFPGGTLTIFETKLFSRTKSQSKNPTVIMRKSGSGDPQLMVSPRDAIHLISCLHGELCDVVCSVNESYGFPLILTLLSLLFHLTRIPYLTSVQLGLRRRTVLNLLIGDSLWIIYHVLKLLLAIEPCHYTVVESRKTESVVCRMLLECPTAGPLSEDLELFLRQLMMQSPAYTPMGLCTVDRPLLASILGAVVTYLVVLIQFEKGPPVKT